MVRLAYIREMRQDRDKLVSALENQHPEYTKEEFFENYLEICKAVYERYKPLINSYGLNEEFDSSALKSRPQGLGE